MKNYCLESLEALASIPRAAFDQAEIASFDLGFAWFDNLVATTFDPHKKLKLFVAEDDGGQVVILPMSYDGNKSMPRKLTALVNFYTALFAPVVTIGASSELLSHALSQVLENDPQWDEVDFSPLSFDDASFVGLFKAMGGIGLLPFKYFCFGNWYLPVGGRSFEEYYASLPSRLKNTVKRKSKQFFATSGARLEIIEGCDRIEAGIADYNKVYATSWKVKEPFPDFIPGLIRSYAEKGWLRLGVAYLNDEPVAAQIWVVAHGRAAIFKLAYDEKFATYSAGSILSAHLMRHVLDVDKVAEVDYLIGDDAYKQDWMSHRRERWGIVAYNPRTFFGLVGALKQILGEYRRKLLTYFRPSNKKPPAIPYASMIGVRCP